MSISLSAKINQLPLDRQQKIAQRTQELLKDVKKPTALPDAKVLYEQHWITEGLSLRKIGRIYGRSRTTILQAIRAVYGKDACNPKMNGLARVVAQEYGQAFINTTRKARGIPGHYLTRKKEQNLTLYQSIDFLDNFAVEQEETQESLRLPLFIWFTKGLTKVLFWGYYGALRDASLTK